MSLTLFAFVQKHSTNLKLHSEHCESTKSMLDTLFVRLFAGVSNVMNVPVSPVLAALVLTAAILFAIVCIVLATIYRKHSHK